MNYRIVSYDKIMKELENGKEVLNKLLAIFDSKDEEITEFIRVRSIYHEETNNMRFHMLIDIDSMDILAIFSLSTQPLILKETISKTKIKKLTGSVKKNEVQSVMVGIIAKNQNAKNIIDGKIIFKEVLKRVLMLNEIAAIKLMHLECKDIRGITKFYEDNDMTLLSDSSGKPITEERNEELYKKYLISLKTMKKMIG